MLGSRIIPSTLTDPDVRHNSRAGLCSMDGELMAVTTKSQHLNLVVHWSTRWFVHGIRT